MSSGRGRTGLEVRGRRLRVQRRREEGRRRQEIKNNKNIKLNFGSNASKVYLIAQVFILAIKE